LADVAGALFDFESNTVPSLLAQVADADLLVVASPTYKATYTGLLKLFLDRIPGGALAGVTAVPLMLGGHWRHALAADLLLKPVLVELGATCPTRGLFLLESEYAGGEALDSWLELARPQLAASVKYSASVMYQA
jgi:FMN reductase